MSVYGARTVKPRGEPRARRTRAEMEVFREALYDIVEEHAPITVRGVFYQATTLGLVPKSETEGYRPVQRELVKMRREGLIPWGWITDGSRSVFGHRRYDGLDSYARQVAANYRKDYWLDSEEYVEVWLEKEALKGVVSPVVVGEFGLDLYVTKGQPSVTYLYEAAEQIAEDGRPTSLYVFTDFDPGGLRIFDRVRRELEGFAPDADLRVERVAVTPEQVARHELPTRPGKAKDPQAERFARDHGEGCVELDAMPPATLRALVKEAIERHMDPDRLRVMRLAEEDERDVLRSVWGGA